MVEKQNLITIDDAEFPLEYDQSLMWIQLQYPTDEDIDEYPIIDMTSDMQWNPSDAPDVTVAATNIKEKPPDIDKIRPCLGWTPKEVIEKTLEATTNYARNSLRLPMRQHYKAQNRALYVRRLQETVATDTFFSSEKSLKW